MPCPSAQPRRQLTRCGWSSKHPAAQPQEAALQQGLRLWQAPLLVAAAPPAQPACPTQQRAAARQPAAGPATCSCCARLSTQRQPGCCGSWRRPRPASRPVRLANLCRCLLPSGGRVVVCSSPSSYTSTPATHSGSRLLLGRCRPARRCGGAPAAGAAALPRAAAAAAWHRGGAAAGRRARGAGGRWAPLRPTGAAAVSVSAGRGGACKGPQPLAYGTAPSTDPPPPPHPTPPHPTPARVCRARGGTDGAHRSWAAGVCQGRNSLLPGQLAHWQRPADQVGGQGLMVGWLGFAGLVPAALNRRADVPHGTQQVPLSMPGRCALAGVAPRHAPCPPFTAPPAPLAACPPAATARCGGGSADWPTRPSGGRRWSGMGRWGTARLFTCVPWRGAFLLSMREREPGPATKRAACALARAAPCAARRPSPPFCLVPIAHPCPLHAACHHSPLCRPCWPPAMAWCAAAGATGWHGTSMPTSTPSRCASLLRRCLARSWRAGTSGRGARSRVGAGAGWLGREWGG